MKTKDARRPVPGRYYGVVTIVLSLLCLGLALVVVLWIIPPGGAEEIPFALHSLLMANYSVDAFLSRFGAVRIDVVADVLSDAGMPDAARRATAFYEGLLTPVPSFAPPVGTLTVLPTAGGTAIQTPIPGETGTITPPIITTGIPTSALTGTVTPSVIATMYTPTPTLRPTQAEPTATSRPPSPTKTTAPQTPTSRPATATTRPPTATQRPPTATPRPPTRTPGPYPYP